jgi:hypothetical protein
MRSTATDTPALSTGAPGFDHLRVIGQAEVIVVAEREQRFAVDHHFRPLRGFKQRALAIEIFGTTGSKACGEIERHAGLDSKKQPCRSCRRLRSRSCLFKNNSKRSQPSSSSYMVLHPRGDQTAAL